MKNKNILYVLVQLFLLVGISSTAFAIECGQVPVEPATVNGATVSMEQLVTASQEVKSYIAAADAYLDCHNAYMTTVEYKDLNKANKDALKATAKTLLEARNAAGDKFNEQVEIYKAANPS